MENHPRPSTSGYNISRSRRNQNRQRSISRSRSQRRRTRSRPQVIIIQSRPRSLSREQCERIARPSLEEIQAAGECPICLDILNESQPNRKLPCNHIFHETCLFTWVQGDISNCPVCRRNLMNSY